MIDGLTVNSQYTIYLSMIDGYNHTDGITSTFLFVMFIDGMFMYLGNLKILLFPSAVVIVSDFFFLF